ncbi:Spo0B domain-containing protein [Clostridium tagluense]|uniref:sensor histidine kinase n=1 Tax=Clostridium tagluense TaxID=360422 RepID=UPI001CF2C76A|nr:Spo0B domain-containing protein [Clostridium tagluense]MCB2312872.1 Spo0B domain-containing protein [Clostridium tagluense]MCB2317638.1 Spo0B domain-containing protein [Clostridium tagluense]MCB2322405.1 Spo0B domain-containing protein [Clostridium tagluense]MCB2327408.1 Spo0B domain-containing protein [Clostridium tagluense]MCB2332140.1 Spo0B domain-containing protein [Clostridium tagluense]
MQKKLNINKTIITVIVLNIIQIMTILCVVLYNYFNENLMNFQEKFNNGELIIYVLIILGVINSFFVIKDISSLNEHNIEYSMLKDTLGQLENLNKTLRGQRHDFMNHLQVVYSLMEMEEYAEATGYIEKVFTDIQRINKVLKTSNPAVNALLQAKIDYGEKRGIKTEILVTSTLEELLVPAWEFCRVLGNIIDNAIYALQERGENKIIKIELFEDLKTYRFRIKNNGPKICQEWINRIFDTGVTTKGEKGEGMGLSIVKDILLKYEGDIEIFSDNEVTIFEGWVPR